MQPESFHHYYVTIPGACFAIRAWEDNFPQPRQWVDETPHGARWMQGKTIAAVTAWVLRKKGKIEEMYPFGGRPECPHKDYILVHVDLPSPPNSISWTTEKECLHCGARFRAAASSPRNTPHSPVVE